MHRLDQRTLAGAARAPEQRIVGGKALRKPHGVVEQHVAHAVDAFEQRKRHAIDRRDRQKGLGIGLPDKSLGAVEIGLPRGGGRKPLQGPGNPLDKARNWFLEVHGRLV
jgi:hypothetical protein